MSDAASPVHFVAELKPGREVMVHRECFEVLRHQRGVRTRVSTYPIAGGWKACGWCWGEIEGEGDEVRT